MQQHTGILYVVATPIGNLGDMTERARKVLAEVDLIAAEDTRETLRLLSHFGITAKLRAYHEHNETAMCDPLLQMLEAGRSIALVSDAGTPLISDPGYTLVAAARERGISVVPVPGASALICALSASGLASDRFLFLGFLPRSRAQRRALFESLASEPGTLIFYESAKRALASLEDLQAVLGEQRRVVIARELTKRFETFLDGLPGALIERLEHDAEQRLGELVILVQGCPSTPDEALQTEWERVLRILCASLPLSQAAALGAHLTGARKNHLYQLGLSLGLDARDD